MKIQNGASAPTGSACLQKVAELFYVTYPKAAKALLGPFLSEADAECSRTRSEGALVTACQVDEVDALTYWHAANNGAVMQAFLGGVRHG